MKRLFWLIQSFASIAFPIFDSINILEMLFFGCRNVLERLVWVSYGLPGIVSFFMNITVLFAWGLWEVLQTLVTGEPFRKLSLISLTLT